MTRVLTPEQLNAELAKAQGWTYSTEIDLYSNDRELWTHENGEQVTVCPFNCLSLLDAWALKERVNNGIENLQASLCFQQWLGGRLDNYMLPAAVMLGDERTTALELSRICFYALTGEVVQMQEQKGGE